MALHVIILAAGQGSRMNSELPKVLHQVGGIPMLERVILSAQELAPQAIHVVYGNGAELVKQALANYKVNLVHQKQQRGTGHAVKQALPSISSEDDVLILYGDVPLIGAQSLQHLLDCTPHQGVGLMVTEPKDPSGFGRIIRNMMGNIEAIIEHHDATDEQRQIREVNTGIMVTSAANLKKWLPKLKNKNAQGEYYLTDIISYAVQQGVSVGGVMVRPHEVQGVNDLWQLAKIERYYQKYVAKKLAYAGVTLLDWRSLQVRGNDYQISKQVTLGSQVILEGRVRIAKHAKIGPNVYLKDVDIGEHAEIQMGSIIEGASIAKHAIIGPYARIRPQTKIAEHAKIGNFVEVKNSSIKKHSKASHLSYIGDTEIGMRVNIGAGAITCNYDGIKKSKTRIENDAFIGSNVALIAPLKIARKATIGAGSVISEDAPANQLTLARARQVSLKNPKRKKGEKP